MGDGSIISPDIWVMQTLNRVDRHVSHVLQRSIPIINSHCRCTSPERVAGQPFGYEVGRLQFEASTLCARSSPFPASSHFRVS